MGFPFLTAFMIFIIWLALRYRKLDRIQEEKEEDFWAKERAANATPAKDISNLSYITIPLDKFPLKISPDPEIVQMEEELTELSTHKILNLTGMTNTELKATYGVPNFKAMSEMGDNFDRLTVLLDKYSASLMERDFKKEAIPVLEFAVGIKTDITESYIKLIDCYKAFGMDQKLTALKPLIEESNLLLKSKILENF